MSQGFAFESSRVVISVVDLKKIVIIMSANPLKVVAYFVPQIFAQNTSGTAVVKTIQVWQKLNQFFAYHGLNAAWLFEILLTVISVLL